MSDLPTVPPRAVVDVTGLSKRYGDIQAVDDLTLQVHTGEVYGFLGPNGAGKTTTLRMLLGLVTPTSGTATVAGHPPGSAAGLASVGALVEAPGLYPFLSGRDNLRVLARQARVDAARVDEVLDTVGLSDRVDHRFATYSQGMKQRLGVAAALLKDPALLVLDEPTNGLDPAGMAQMRTMIRRLGDGHRTVLLSSHLLGEVEQVCDRVGIIHSGRLVAQGTVDELRGDHRLRIRAEPLDRAQILVDGLPHTATTAIADGVLLVTTGPQHAPGIACLLTGDGIDLHELVHERASLEDIFLNLTTDRRAR